MRGYEFSKGMVKPIIIKDSRFGVRRLFLNTQERPRIGVYKKPGRGQRQQQT
jgi:hypothetical protein